MLRMGKYACPSERIQMHPTNSSETNASRNAHAAHQGRVPLHAKLRPQTAAEKGTEKGQVVVPLEAELFRIAAAEGSEAHIRAHFRRAAMLAAKAVGVCLLRYNGARWTLDRAQQNGRTPTSEQLKEEFSATCNRIAEQDEPVLLGLEFLDNLPGMFMPIRTPAGTSEILLLVLRSARESALAADVAKKVAAAMQLWMKAHSQAQSRWQLQSLASIMELVEKIESSTDINDAAATIANEMLQFLGCRSVAVGVNDKQTADLKALSGVHKMDKTSATSQSYQQAMNESAVRGQQAVYPAVADDNAHLLLAHKQLSALAHSAAVFSQPLTGSDDAEIGQIVFTGPVDLLQGPEFSRFVGTAAPHIASALAILKRSEKNALQKFWRMFKEKTSARTRQLIPLGLLAVGLLMLVPVKYKVRCHCTTEPMARRFAVAPFDGTIVSGFVEPGDYVEKGAVLAEMDGRQIRLKLASVTAERQQSVIQRRIELKEGNVPKTFLSELENERLTSEKSVLEHKKDHLQIRSPISGVVLDGSLERAEAASVRTGEVLFEIGPMDQLKVEIAIPAEDIPQVQAGNDVKIWIEGREDQPLVSQIKRIHPRSEIRNAQNVFIARIDCPNTQGVFRPGMKGTVRIDGQHRSLGWSLFHKPVNYIRSRLTWW